MTKRIQSTRLLKLAVGFLLLALMTPGALFAQDPDMLCDWEDGGTCLSWDFVDGATTFEVVDNPLAEGINNVIKALKRQCFGFKNMKYFRLKIMQRCGYLNTKYYPEPAALKYRAAPQI